MIIMLPIVAVIWYQLCQWRGISCGYDVPTLPRILFDLIAAIICEEIFFYYSHRLFHHPYIYKRVHKKHHEWTAPIGLVAVYAHPIEHVLCNIIPVFSGSLIFGSHLLSVWLWLFVAMWGTTIHHSGYHFPLLLSSEFHDFHHLKFNYCFGLLGVLDYLHGTDVLFRKSKASKRHKTLFGITPLSKSIPDEKQ
ncbi:fatty acid hydroxylase domain-containing protein 2-like [Saccoglossus kowalevskii]|uniref:Fatty acid hydroxylase domain-containing protein 2-like n=1 Tax=Saccoglossus kowalevskii TaxID=10224 RepID=A0ABM0M6E2_SACKO|nr:PREDICTED: fatty acid hydroxylase domain-containing protein 2-like [Saccoglossus kowalevskii]